MAEEKVRILFVDDDRFAMHHYIEALLDAGYHVTTAESVEEALEFVRSEPFDAVLLDIMMPPGKKLGRIETAGGFRTGKALAREIRELLPEAKLIAFTLSNDADIQAWFTKDNSVAYIEKRETMPDQLPRIVSRIIRKGQESPKAFIVHGRDHKTVLELKNYLQNRLGFDEPVVLSEKSSRGMTLIEKFEHYASEADIVFVLFTPDDFGGLARKRSIVKSRPRMNVIFEYGYFLGTLRRRSGRVFLLSKGEIEFFSDISGIVYIDISQGIEAAGETIRRELEDWL